MDQCKNCEARGNLTQCINEDCGKHNDWIVKELMRQITSAISVRNPQTETTASANTLPLLNGYVPYKTDQD